MKKIAIAAGGTGGHIYPALATAKRLEQDAAVVFIGTKYGLEKNIVPKHGIVFETIFMRPIRGKGLVRKIIAPLFLLIGTLNAIRCLRKHKCDVVLTMGGYVSAPVGIAAKILRKPLLIHEQNAVAGLTNKMLHKIADKTFQAYPDSFARGEAITVGNPVRAELLNLEIVRAPRIRLTIVGGSQGARALNQAVPKALKLLKAKNIRFSVTHQCGTNGYVETKSEYSSLDVEANVVSYIDDMAKVYENTDLIIGRAGAMTCAELMAVALPSILVPFPAAVDDHQTKNAAQLVEMGAALMVKQSDLTPEKLAAILEQLATSPEKIDAMRTAIKECAPKDAAQTIAKECLAYA